MNCLIMQSTRPSNCRAVGIGEGGAEGTNHQRPPSPLDIGTFDNPISCRVGVDYGDYVSIYPAPSPDFQPFLRPYNMLPTLVNTGAQTANHQNLGRVFEKILPPNREQDHKF